MKVLSSNFMTVNRQGCTRIVFMFRSFVVKIPNFIYSWQHFIQGLLCNIQENNLWKHTKIADENAGEGYWKHEKKWQMLCPVKWCSWGGWILIMQRADTSRHEKEVEELIKSGKAIFSYSAWKEHGFGGDDKYDNYGYLGETLVKIDYQ